MTSFEELIARHEIDDAKARRKVYKLIGITVLFFIVYATSLILKYPFVLFPIGFFVSAGLTAYAISRDMKRLVKNNNELTDAVVKEIQKVLNDQANTEIHAASVTQRAS